MVRKPVTLITGASGEVGYGLLEKFAETGDTHVVALDLKQLTPEQEALCDTAITGDILDNNLLERLISEYEIHAIYHLAALLSTRAEFSPDTAHRVNVDGTLNLIRLAHEQARWHGNPVRFLFPSSIAVYGLPDLATKRRAGRIRESEWNLPTTMYGCNKCYCEQLGRYYSEHFRQLAAEPQSSGVDFRAVRFPGLISAITVPAGGTSDYAAEMIHAAARGESYASFVGEDARIPFMVMPDAIKALLQLAAAPVDRLSQRVYNVTSFSLSAGELRDRVRKAFPQAEITFAPDQKRAGIIDTWPADVDDTLAARDWDWAPDYDVARAFNEYLVPTIAEKYEA